MSGPPLLNAAGRRRSPATLPGYLAGRPPRNKGLRYPPDPPTVEEIVAAMREVGDDNHGARLRALIVLLWGAGLRIQERSPSPNTTSSPAPDRCSSAKAKAAAGGKSAWTRGAGSTSALGSGSGWRCRSARCCA
jgi:hypothetical protein